MGAAEKLPASGYFKISLQAARAIVAATDALDVLAGYIVLCEGAFGDGRRLTACGAKAIAKYTGRTDWRSKRTMEDLKSLCFGDRGDSWLIRDARARMKNASVYALGDWPGTQAYLPALLVKSEIDPAPLKRLCTSEACAETKRDALLLLLDLYATTDYPEWMGARPDCFAYQLWDTEGTREVGDVIAELGHYEGIGGYSLWSVAPPENDEWQWPSRFDLFAGDAERGARALGFLLESGSACKVAVVSDGPRNYPLWVFNQAYRAKLVVGHNLRADLAKQMHYLAAEVGADPDNRIIIAATDPDRAREGTGLFYCLAKSRPIVRTLLIPRLHAPTPCNLDGLREVAQTCLSWTSTITQLRAKAKAA